MLVIKFVAEGEVKWQKIECSTPEHPTSSWMEEYIGLRCEIDVALFLNQQFVDRKTVEFGASGIH